jgi:hypothetical protein
MEAVAGVDVDLCLEWGSDAMRASRRPLEFGDLGYVNGAD